MGEAGPSCIVPGYSCHPQRITLCNIADPCRREPSCDPQSILMWSHLFLGISNQSYMDLSYQTVKRPLLSSISTQL